MNPVTLEVCVDDAEGLAAAIEGGAGRIELCSALSTGGLTPSAGLMHLAATAPVPVYALIRPRPGDFCFSPADIAAMTGDIAAARAAGLTGVVLGASLSDGRLDATTLGALIGAASGLRLALHRAFDLVPDIESAVETAVELGFERVLTSGGAPSALAGLAGMRAAHTAARGRIAIMPGAGINAGNIGAILSAVPVSDIHASCSAPAPAADPRALAFGFASPTARRTSAALVRALRDALPA